MEYTLTTYVEFFGCSRQTVVDRDVTEVSLPEGECGFRFYDQVTAMIEVDGLIVPLQSSPFNHSPWHFKDGQVYTRADVLAGKVNVKNGEFLEKRLGSDGWDRLFVSNDNWFYCFLESDEIVLEAEAG